MESGTFWVSVSTLSKDITLIISVLTLAIVETDFPEQKKAPLYLRAVQYFVEFPQRSAAPGTLAPSTQVRWHLVLRYAGTLVLQHTYESVHRTYEDAVAAKRLDVVDEG